jgi:hypothetical protein
MKIIRRILSKVYHGLENRIIFFLIYIKYSKKLKQFEDIHKGKRCFIIGNGPSLKIEDLEKLKNEYTFGANKIFVAFEDTDWRPTYYCIQDFKMITSELESIKQNAGADVKFIAGNPLVSKKNVLPDWIYFFVDTRSFYPNYPLFSEDIANRIFDGGTVTYAEIQFAVYMGFSEIYLLGVDFNYSVSINNDNTFSKTETKNHFSDKYLGNGELGKHFNYPSLENSLLAYKSAREYADRNNISIYNATRGGKLEVFERVDFDTIIN